MPTKLCNDQVEIVLNHHSPRYFRKEVFLDVRADEIIRAKCGWWNADPEDCKRWRLISRITNENSSLVKGECYDGPARLAGCHDFNKFWKTLMDRWFWTGGLDKSNGFITVIFYFKNHWMRKGKEIIFLRYLIRDSRNGIRGNNGWPHDRPRLNNFFTIRPDLGKMFLEFQPVSSREPKINQDLVVDLNQSGPEHQDPSPSIKCLNGNLEMDKKG